MKQHGRHHSKTAESGRHHVAHDVPVIILARPDISAFRTDHARNSVVDQGIEILDPERFKFFFIFRIINFLENILEGMVVNLRDRIFSRKPEYLLGISIVKAAARKAADRFIGVVHALRNAAALIIEYRKLCFRPRPAR